jgi:hypothetical protein
MMDAFRVTIDVEGKDAGRQAAEISPATQGPQTRRRGFSSRLARRDGGMVPFCAVTVSRLFGAALTACAAGQEGDEQQAVRCARHQFLDSRVKR